jgi:hypothetical protein
MSLSICSGVEYGLDSSAYQRYLVFLKERLLKVAHIWPPLEHLKQGTKNDLFVNLDVVAMSETSTPRPSWTLLRREEPIPETSVIKRTHSDCGAHVLRPGSMDRNWDYIERETIPGSLWIAQSYVPELAILGEWRVFVIGGDIVSVVHTVYKQKTELWNWEMVEVYYTLEELR